jgi:hypothetical protein
MLKMLMHCGALKINLLIFLISKDLPSNSLYFQKNLQNF